MKATMTSYFADQDSVSVDCEIVVASEAITLSYDGENKAPIIWRGRQLAAGHFELRSEQVDGIGTLHRWPEDSLSFVGNWIDREKPNTARSSGLWTVDIEE